MMRLPPNHSCQPTPVEHAVSRPEPVARRGCIQRSAFCSFPGPSDWFTSLVYGSSSYGQGREESNGDEWVMTIPRSSIDVVGGWELCPGRVTPNQSLLPTLDERAVSSPLRSVQRGRALRSTEKWCGGGVSSLGLRLGGEGMGTWRGCGRVAESSIDEVR